MNINVGHQSLSRLTCSSTSLTPNTMFSCRSLVWVFFLLSLLGIPGILAVFCRGAVRYSWTARASALCKREPNIVNLFEADLDTKDRKCCRILTSEHRTNLWALWRCVCMYYRCVCLCPLHCDPFHFNPLNSAAVLELQNHVRCDARSTNQGKQRQHCCWTRGKGEMSDASWHGYVIRTGTRWLQVRRGLPVMADAYVCTFLLRWMKRSASEDATEKDKIK